MELFRILLGKAAELVEKGDNTYGGKYVVNPSGGLISKGHPLGATGMLILKNFSSILLNISSRFGSMR